MSECYLCGDIASFIKEEGGFYMCRVCIANDKDLESEGK